MIALALTAAALAAPPPPPAAVEGARMIMGCSSLDEIRALLDAFEGLPTDSVDTAELAEVLSDAEGYGVDAAQPIWFAGGPGDDPVVIEMGVLDETRWKNRMKISAIRGGSGQQLSSNEDTWFDEDGAQISLQVDGDRGSMTLTPVGAGAPNHDAISLLDAREDVDGCWAAMDLQGLGDLSGTGLNVEGVLFQQRAGDPTLRLAIRAGGIPESFSDALSGRAPRSEAIGAGSWPVLFSLRLNGEMDAMLAAYRELLSSTNTPMFGRLPPPPPGLASLPAAPGAELAVGFDSANGEPIFGAAIPLKRRGQVRRARRRLARELGLSHRSDGALPLDDDLWLQTAGRHVLLSNRSQALEELRAGRGQSWTGAGAALAESPGVFVRMDAASMGMLQMGLPPIAGNAGSEFAISMRWMKPDLIVLDLYAPGLLERFTESGLNEALPGGR